ncbi:MAG: LEA type 2 family protein [Desulfobacterales bacterium]|jgi:LEA14-like dessication related protein|nr:LEA type 2 family protein [Desulfobacterales bacterium]
MNAFPSIAKAAAACGAILALMGCAGIGKRLEPPRISLADIRVQQSSGLETAFMLQLRVINPNDVDLEVRAVSLDLEINGQPFASGAASNPVTVPAYGSNLVEVQTYSSVIRMLTSMIGILPSGEIAYRARGHLRIGGDALLPPSLPFDASGTFDFSEFAKAGK